jgi:CubicO group peptidase (beta-lactamase class C family)
VELIPWLRFEEPNPAASINASARDLSKWLRFQLGDGTYGGAFASKRLVSAANLAETHTPQMVIRVEGLVRAEHPFTNQINYAMGWVVQDYRGQLLVSHAGIADGMRAHITLAPNARLGVAILCNLHKTRLNLALSNAIVDQLLSLPYKDWNAHYQALVKAAEKEEKDQERQRQANRQPNAKPTHPLAAYTGTYQDPAYGTARVTLENGALVWHWSSFHSRLEHYQFDTFTIMNDLLSNPALYFTVDKNGQVAAMRFHTAEFQKVK